ncbi:MAG TPA: hypothetical protein VGO55_05005 [Allosphingosinicella sp.]|jgi:hypothetical protein|nr:hypothetical protein [Allosphingosinicella sp.]
MAGNTEIRGIARTSRWRIAAWTVAALLLLLPLLAMQVSDEVVWGPADFATAGALIAGVGAAFELVVRMTGNLAYRAAVAIALAAAFLIIWINLAVGIIGTEADPANLVYGAVLATGIAGALIARLRPHGMALAMAATALAQALVAIATLIAGFGQASMVTAIFVAPWLLSAWLFRVAAR